MSVDAFVGKTGGGKSYNCVRLMCSYMARGGTVVTNILFEGWDIEGKTFRSESPVRKALETLGWRYQEGQYIYIPFDDMVSDARWFSRIPAGISREKRTLVVVDEATDLFDNLDRDKVRVDAGYRELFRFLRLHRHAHVDVIFICQDLTTINSRLRGLVKGIYRSTDMSGFRFASLGMIKFPFNVFLVQRFDSKGKTEISQRQWVKKRDMWFSCYKSEAFADDIGIKIEATAIDENAGKIIQTKKGVPMWAKVAALLALLVSVHSLVGGSARAKATEMRLSEMAACISNLVVAARAGGPVLSPGASEVATPGASAAEWSIERGPISYHSAGAMRWAMFRGCRLDVGMPSEYGIVQDIQKNGASAWVRCMRPTGEYVFLFEGDAKTPRDGGYTTMLGKETPPPG